MWICLTWLDSMMLHQDQTFTFRIILRMFYQLVQLTSIWISLFFRRDSFLALLIQSVYIKWIYAIKLKSFRITLVVHVLLITFLQDSTLILVCLVTLCITLQQTLLTFWRWSTVLASHLMEHQHPATWLWLLFM